MTIDERLEVISSKLELLATLHIDLEHQTAERFAEVAKRFAETDKRFAETLQFINRLAHVAEAHEQRLDDIEGR